MIHILSKSIVSLPGLATLIFRSKGSLWFPGCDHVVDRRNNILAVLDGPMGKRIIPACNIVTDTGDVHYAQDGAEEAPTNVFGILELASAGTPGKAAIRSGFTVIGSTQKAHDGTYPKTNDVDPDNTGTTGTDVVTYLTSYTKADFNAASITHGIITNVTPAAGEPLLTGYAYGAAFAKTADDTLKNFVNHQFNGV